MTGPGATATWLYAVAAAAGPEEPAAALEDVPGVAGEVVRVLRGGGLTAVVGSVPVRDFGEDALRDHLEDLGWLEEAARAHHGVIAAAARAGDVVPLRFATLYHDDDRVRGLLEERRARFTAALDRVAGCAEWGVKAYGGQRADEDGRTEAAGDTAAGDIETGDTGAGPPEPAAGQARARPDTPGTAYLLRRRAQRRGRESAHRRTAEQAADVHAALDALAEESAHHPPQDPRLARYTGWMVLNASYLVPDARAEEFAAAVDRLGRRHPGLRLELVGPWPPYSFTGEAVPPDTAAPEGP